MANNEIDNAFRFGAFDKPFHEQIGVDESVTEKYQKFYQQLFAGRLLGLVADREYSNILARLLMILNKIKRENHNKTLNTFLEGSNQ